MQGKLDQKSLDYLYRAVLLLEDKEQCRAFFEDLCTVQELKSLSQRLQVASMLNGHKVYTDIVTQTGASTATISRVNRALHYGSDGYKQILEKLEG